MWAPANASSIITEGRAQAWNLHPRSSPLQRNNITEIEYSFSLFSTGNSVGSRRLRLWIDGNSAVFRNQKQLMKHKKSPKTLFFRTKTEKPGFDLGRRSSHPVSWQWMLARLGFPPEQPFRRMVARCPENRTKAPLIEGTVDSISDRR